MKCDVCGGNMEVGIALNSSTRENVLSGPVAMANADNIGFIPVMKCEDCGRSLNEEELRSHS